MRAHHHQRYSTGDRGQVTPLLAVVMVLAVGVVFALVSVGNLLADRAVARTAADAAALAGAAGTDADADALARVNGAEIVALHRNGAEIEVEVRVGRATARARARAARVPVPVRAQQARRFPVE